LTDVGNAESFHQLHGRDFIFIKEKKIWVKFDGVRWVEAKGEAKRAMIETMRSKSKLAMNSFPSDSEQMKRIVKWCLASESKFRLTGAMDIATIYNSKNHNDFDKDPLLLCCKNGVVDLRTGKLRPSAPEDMLQRSTNLIYDSAAKCPRWIQFLEEIFKRDKELIDFIQRAIGYTLTGLTREQCLFLLYGTGANGKSVFLGVLEEMLGEYGLTTPFSTFKENNYDGIPNEVARMAGARFIKSVEIKEGASLNEERIKSLTGGDRVTARFLHCEYFEFDPIAKFWIAVNHKPVVRGTDDAIWRPIRLIDFEETFPPERRDKDLLDKLRRELPGILNWAIEGCLKYQEKGLEPVEKVRRATEQYRSESDIINQFLQEKTIEKAGARAIGSDLYNTYKSWCAENGEQALNSTQFGRRLTEKGFEKEKRGSYVYRLGIEIVQDVS
jgi:putative DNA primase/helicase